MVQNTHHLRTSNSMPMKTKERHPPEGEKQRNAPYYSSQNRFAQNGTSKLSASMTVTWKKGTYHMINTHKNKSQVLWTGWPSVEIMKALNKSWDQGLAVPTPSPKPHDVIERSESDDDIIKSKRVLNSSKTKQDMATSPRIITLNPKSDKRFVSKWCQSLIGPSITSNQESAINRFLERNKGLKHTQELLGKSSHENQNNQ